MNCSRCDSEIRPGLDVCLRCGATVRSTQSTNNASSKLQPSSSDRNSGTNGHSTEAAGSASHQPTAIPRVSTKTSESAEISGISDRSALIFIGVVVLLMSVVMWSSSNQSNNGTSSVSRSAPTKPKQGRNLFAEEAGGGSQTASADNTRLVESKPPVGTKHLLSRNQIRYCHLEEIRIDAMQTEISQFSEVEILNSNSIVDDYNSRCASYRYREGSVSAVKRSIHGKETEYRQEGIARVRSWRVVTYQDVQRPANSNSTKLTPKPNLLVRNSQRILASLGYNTGPIDGLVGNKVTAATKQFQQDYGFEVDGVIDNDFYSKLYALRPRDGVTKANALSKSPETSPGVVIDENASLGSNRKTKQLPVSTADQKAISYSCNGQKLAFGPAAYNKCVEEKVSDLRRNPANFNLTGISTADQKAISYSCNGQKLAFGPGAYNKCVKEKVSELRGNSANVNLTGISTADQKAISYSCNGQKLAFGPGAYNKCVKEKVSELRGNPANFNLTGISTADQKAISYSCNGQKLAFGPGAYNKCVKSQLSDLRRP
jgi:peptidoglycan hydrolase-like protein with peptidoglycan-binding domain